MIFLKRIVGKVENMEVRICELNSKVDYTSGLGVGGTGENP